MTSCVIFVSYKILKIYSWSLYKFLEVEASINKMIKPLKMLEND